MGDTPIVPLPLPVPPPPPPPAAAAGVKVPSKRGEGEVEREGGFGEEEGERVGWGVMEGRLGVEEGVPLPPLGDPDPEEH